MKTASRQNNTHVLIVTVLLAINPLIGMVVDLIAPSLPSIAGTLSISTSTAKNLIAIYLIGYAAGNFVTGFLTDALGRKKILMFDLFGFALTSLMPIFFPHYLVLLAARLAQGLLIGSTSVVIRAIFSDVLSANELVKLGTLLGTTWAIGPVLGPIIGGFLQTYFGWYAVFGFFTIISLLALGAVMRFIPETHTQRQALHPQLIVQNLRAVFCHREFIAISVLMGFVYSILIVFNALGPFVIQTGMHHTPLFFGNVAMLMGILFILGTFVSRYSLKRFQLSSIYQFQTLLISVVTVICAIWGIVSVVTLPLILIATSLSYISCAMLFPMSTGKGLTYFRHIAGTASALMFLIAYGIASLCSWMASLIRLSSGLPLLVYYAVASCICLLIYRRYLSKMA